MHGTMVVWNSAGNVKNWIIRGFNPQTPKTGSIGAYFSLGLKGELGRKGAYFRVRM